MNEQRYAKLTAVDPPEDDGVLLLLPDASVLDVVIRSLAREAADQYCDRMWGPR